VIYDSSSFLGTKVTRRGGQLVYTVSSVNPWTGIVVCEDDHGNVVSLNFNQVEKLTTALGEELDLLSLATKPAAAIAMELGTAMAKAAEDQKAWDFGDEPYVFPKPKTPEPAFPSDEILMAAPDDWNLTYVMPLNQESATKVKKWVDEVSGAGEGEPGDGSRWDEL
jgi:hypothetical protein